ncbi:MAG: type I-E CRISPR-associated protein Cse1/CasA [Methylocystis sp.]
MAPSPFSLLSASWLPVRRRSGARHHIRPAEIATNFGDDPIVAFAWGRPDFDAASREFMIGLLATAFAPEDGRAFKKYWREPPGAAQLEDAFAPFADAFVLDGEGPRFGQDFDALEDPNYPNGRPLDLLFIDGASDNAITNTNTDFFIKRGRTANLSRAAAAIAVFALQTFCSGNRWLRRSLRGAGAVTTLLIPVESDAPLWRVLWLNTPAPNLQYPPPVETKNKIFPWLAPTITSDGTPPRTVSPAASHVLLTLWATPRRIRLRFQENAEETRCPITGEIDSIKITAFDQAPHGTKYVQFKHPLSPYNLQKKTNDWSALHLRAGKIAYQHWPTLVWGPSDGGEPAAIVPTAKSRLQSLDIDRARLFVFGYSMDDMKAVTLVEATMPFFPSPPSIFEEAIKRFVDAADIVAELTAHAVRRAKGVKKNEKTEKLVILGYDLDANDKTAESSIRAMRNSYNDGDSIAALRESFFARTEQDFYFDLLPTCIEKLQSLEGDPAPTLRALAEKWRVRLKDEAIALFEEAVSFDDLPLKIMERAVPARHDLLGTFLGYGAMGKKLFAALELPPPQPAKKSAKKSGKAA